MLHILQKMPKNSWLLLQNEINDIPFLIENAKACSLKAAINQAPCTAEVRSYPAEYGIIYHNSMSLSRKDIRRRLPHKD